MQLMKRYKVAILLIAILITGFIVFSYTPAKWLLRRNCICSRAHQYPSKSFEQDELLFRVIDKEDITNETMWLTTARCIHGESLLIRVFGSQSYAVTLMDGSK